MLSPLTSGMRKVNGPLDNYNFPYSVELKIGNSLHDKFMAYIFLLFIINPVLLNL